jgi:F-type H+-transporting ATPase subunit b
LVWLVVPEAGRVWNISIKGGTARDCRIATARDFVAKKELDLILDAEQKAEAEIAEARAQARQILDEASRKAELIPAEAARKAQAKASEIVEAAKKDAEKAHQAAMEEVKAEIENIKSVSSKNFDTAVKLVVDRIMNAV